MAGEMKELAETNIGKAILADNAQQLKLCLKNKEDILYKDRKGNTYIHFVSSLYRPHVFYILTSTRIDIQSQNRHGNTALHVTALQRECGHVADLMACGIDPLIKNKDGLTAAELKSQNRYWHTVYNKYKPGLFQATSSHDVTRVRELLHCWCCVDVRKNGQTLRQFAASLKHHDIVGILDEHTPTLDAIYGVLEDDPEKVAEALKKLRCNINFLNHASQKRHILQHAVRSGDLQTVDMVCKAGADVNTLVLVNNFLHGPLYFEVLHPNIRKDIMWSVLKSGADFSLKDERGRNVMIFALDKCNGHLPVEVFQYMLQGRASFADRDNTGCTIRDVARFNRRRDIVSLIDKFYVKILRSSDMERLRQLAVDGYDGLLIQFNHRDSLLYAAGNETDDVLKFIEWLPSFQEEVKCLHLEIKYGNYDSVISMIENSDTPLMLINSRDKAFRTPLMQAVIFNKLKVLEYLLSWKSDIAINARNVCNRTAYHFACGLGDEGEIIRNKLESAGIQMDLKDVDGRVGMDYLTMVNNRDWIHRLQKNVYGMEVELFCVDKYEELRRVICSPKRNLNDFSKVLKRINFPVTAFPRLLDSLMSEYRDLIFLALDYRKEEIAKRLADLGADLRREEKYEKVDEVTGEKREQKIDAVTRAYEIGMEKLAEYLSKKQKIKVKQQLPKHIEKQLQNNALPTRLEPALVTQLVQ